MLTEQEIEALAKVAGVKLTPYGHFKDGTHVWDAAVVVGYCVVCVGSLGKTKREAMNNAWEKYVTTTNL